MQNFILSEDGVTSMSKDTNRGKIKSTKTCFMIIHQLQEKGPCRLSEIADQLDIAESTTHRHLKTLQELRYVSRKGDLYQIGLRFARLGMAAKTRDSAVMQVEPYVKQLAEQTEERAQFVSEDHGLGVYLHRYTGANAVEVGTNIGRQIHLHSASSGKVILAQYDKDHVDSILDRWGLPANTEQTITDRDRFYEELDRIRERGYAFNREEAVKGVHATGVPIKPNKRVIGAITVAGPSHRLQGEWFEKELPELLLATANEIEVNITHDEAEQPGNHIVE